MKFSAAFVADRSMPSSVAVASWALVVVVALSLFKQSHAKLKVKPIAPEPQKRRTNVASFFFFFFFFLFFGLLEESEFVSSDFFILFISITSFSIFSLFIFTGAENTQESFFEW